MAITTKMTEVQAGITYGYSDTCDTLFANGDWTASELARFSWCRWQDRYTNCLSSTTINTGSWQGAAVCNVLSYFQNNGGDLKTKYVDDLIPTHEPYAFNILMYGRDDDLCLNSSNASNYKVVTSCSDFQKLYVQVDEYKSQEGTINVQHPTARTIDINRLLWSSGGVYNSDTGTYTSWITVWTVFVLDENTFFVTRGMGFPNREPGLNDGSFGSAQLNFRPSNSLDLDNTPTDDKWQYSSTQITTYDETKYLLRWYKNGLTGIEEDIWTAQDQYGCWDVDSDVSVIMHGSWGNYQYTYGLRTENAVKNAIAYTGLRWKYRIGDTEHIYTPIIDGDGYITGWSTDPDVETKLNDIVDVTGNNISPTPPAPPTPSSGDDMEAMATGATGSSGGFTHFYVMSPQDLIDFLADFYTRASSGETLTNNLVCSYILGIPSSEFCATEEVEIAIHNSAQGTPFVSQAKYSHITATNNLLVVGSFDVPRITNTFYDFAPYSTYEVFIPCCGWIPLPDTVAGRKINVEMYIDIASCCLKAAVKTNDLGICAVANGVLGAAIPIAVIESGILRGNNIQAGLGIIGGGINTGVGAGSGNAMGIGFGVQQILSGLVECTIAGNTNYTQQKGGTGDITQFAMGHKCYMKVTHPDIDEVVNNSIFGHSVGYLCNSIDKLEKFKGFTVCGNPHVTFSASAEEREEIERLLSMGVIL